MTKKERHLHIKKIILENEVGTQEDIKQLLERDNIYVTQATLSRDLREIGLLKLRNEDGKLYYSISETIRSYFSQAARSYIQKVNRAGFMLVLHTALGEADVLANIIDKEENEAVLGTVAGADTLLVICKDEHVAADLESDLAASL